MSSTVTSPQTQPPLFESPEPASPSASSSITSDYTQTRDPEKPPNDRHNTIDTEETCVETNFQEDGSEEYEEVIEFVEEEFDESNASQDLEANNGNGSPRHNVWHRFRRATGLDSAKRRKKSDLDMHCIDYHPEGYPMLAAMLNSDENFLMCRRYGFLHNRVLLYRQDELRELESRLLALDRMDFRDGNKRFLKSREADDSRSDVRANLIREIDDKLREYDDAVIRARQMASLPHATHRNFQSVFNWMHNKQPLCESENQFTTAEQDVVALVDPKEGGWFDAFIEDYFLPMLPDRLTRLAFSDPAQRRSTTNKETKLYSKHRVDTFARILITMVAVALLMAPVVVLFLQEESGTAKILVILAFTLIFSAALSVFTKAKRHEVFAATAAYCAVLVVFLGNLN
ncbi:hypothetical protein BKA81DRAFT_368412 [Phyllosticta paracitricarpa]